MLPTEQIPHETERRSLAMCIKDLTSRRLIEGIALQMELAAVVVTEADISNPSVMRCVDLLLADEYIAEKVGSRGNRFEHLNENNHFALVAVVDASVSEQAGKRDPGAESPFDGLLKLPQIPTVVLAQLSVILYAHRAHVRRYEFAIEELNLNRRIFRSVTSGISIASALKPDFPLEYVNPAFEVMTGYSLEEIDGKNCRFLQGTEHDQPGLTLIRDALKGNRETVAIIRNYRRDGVAFWNELALSPIRDRDGLVTHFVGIQNDITARIEFEEALRESEKLAAVGRLAATIAHEINNPLESVTNLLYLARREKDESLKDEYLDSAEQELGRVSQLTTQSLRFYKQSSKAGAIKPVDLITAVLDIYSAKLLNYRIKVERKDLMSESIVCLESEIRQVLSNLVRNAMDAMLKEGGRLLVRTREATNWNTRVKGVNVTVADTGTGMSSETISKLYTAFYTTKGVSGTGLGLWVSSEIVQRHHGKLSVRSRQGVKSGTVFTLFLPYQAVSP